LEYVAVLSYDTAKEKGAPLGIFSQARSVKLVIWRVPKWTNFTIWAARARSGRKWYQNGPISPSGRPGPDLVENGTKMDQFHRLGSKGLIWSKMVPK